MLQRISSLNWRISSARSCSPRERKCSSVTSRPCSTSRRAREPLLVDLGREELGERGAHSLLPGAAPGEIDVCVDGKAHAGKHVLERSDLIAREADRLAKAQPRLDAALGALSPVVVEDALDPAPALVAIGHVGEDRGVLDRDADLVIEAVEDPTLHLRARAAAVVHCDVERVMDVVALALRAQLPFEFLSGPR